MVLTGPLLLLLVTLASRAAAFSLAAGTHAARAPTNAPVAMVLQQPSARNTQTFDTQLEALFYSFDADSNGSIDQGEFESAIDELGFALSKERVGELFTEFDADDSGTITLDEFKTLVSQTGLAPSPRLKYAMDLFKRYDVDASGSIDKFEFKQIAAEIEADQSRRTFLACGAAALGSLVVAKYSEEYQWAQKTFRGLYLEPKAEAAQHAAFPTALLSSDLDSAVARTLGSRGYTPSNTLFAHSVCSDEVNNKDEQLVDLMVSRWGEGFALGGLGGLPFAGKSGFRAYLHHVPDSGRLLVLFAPHVGIDAEGRIGSLQREGQTALSKACGAAVGAYKAVSAKKASAAPAAPAASAVVAEADAGLDPFDPELKTIVSLLGARINGIEAAPDPLAFVTYQMYAIVRDLVDSCITNTDDVWDYASQVVVLGGVMVNRKVGGDFFQPLSFEELPRLKGQPSIDLYEQTFGKRPDLTTVLGSEAAVTAMYTKSARTS